MNSEQARWYSAESGFVLSDALVAAAVVSILSILVCSAVKEIRSADEQIAQAYQESDEHYADVAGSIGECVCETEDIEEQTTATS